jgi:rubrerythrin
MPYNQTKDVLDQARMFHRRLGLFYEELKDSVSMERTKALLDYMSRHENYLDECLIEFKEQVSDNVLDTYMQYGSNASAQIQIDNFEIQPEMTVDDVFAAAMHFDACLIKFYREMTEKTTNGKVREVFENLLVMEQHEQIELSKQTLELSSLEAFRRDRAENQPETTTASA